MSARTEPLFAFEPRPVKALVVLVVGRKMSVYAATSVAVGASLCDDAVSDCAARHENVFY